MKIAAAISAAILFAVVLVNAHAASTSIRDFTTFYTAGRIVREGEGSRVYDLQKEAQVEASVVPGVHLLAFLHPPFEAWLFVPISMLPYTAAYTVWGAINIALWIFFVYLIRPYAPVPRHPLQYLLLCFVFFPLWFALNQGQTSILLLVFLSTAFVCLKRRREGWAGVFVGLGLVKFSVAGPLALIFLLKGKWRVVAGFAGTAFLLGLASLLAVGIEGMKGYVHLLTDLTKHPINIPSGSDVSMMPNLRGFFHGLFTPVLPGMAVNAAVALTSIFLIGYVAWRWRHLGAAEGEFLDLMFAAALLVSQVIAFHILIYDLSLTLLALLLILGSARYPEGSPWRPARTAVIAALYAIPLYLAWIHLSSLTPVLLVLLAWAAMAGSRAPIQAREAGRGHADQGAASGVNAHG